MTKEYISGSFMFVYKKLRGVKNTKMELKTRKTNFHKIGAQIRIFQTVGLVFAAVVGPSPFLVNSTVLDTLPTTVDLRVNSAEGRLLGTENSLLGFFFF